MSALYQKYRPIRFADVAGQEVVKTTLQNELAAGTTVHAYLFAGPRAVGKTTTARLLARSLNCLARKTGEWEPCNECETCSAILQGKVLDVLEIDAASNNGVDNVRENIMAAARVASAQVKYKVFILDEVHMLSIGAFNALLKLLEEPPANVVFILATTELHKVPATIISRCQRFDFKRIEPAAMLARLQELTKKEGKAVTDGVLHEIVKRAGGCARDAESLLGQILSLGDMIDEEAASVILPRSDYELVKRLARAMLTGESESSFTVVRDVVDQGIDITTFTADLMSYVREVLTIAIGVQAGIGVTTAEKADIQSWIVGIPPQRMVFALDYLISAQKEVKWVSLPQLPLELAIVRTLLSVGAGEGK